MFLVVLFSLLPVRFYLYVFVFVCFFSFLRVSNCVAFKECILVPVYVKKKKILPFMGDMETRSKRATSGDKNRSSHFRLRISLSQNPERERKIISLSGL